jgi:hypothetical protein
VNNRAALFPVLLHLDQEVIYHFPAGPFLVELGLQFGNVLSMYFTFVLQAPLVCLIPSF